MMRVARLAVVFLSHAASLAAQGFGVVQGVQVESERAPAAGLSRDVNGDGVPDLVLSVVVKEKEHERTLRIHLAGRDGELRNEPDHSLDVPADVTAFAVADVHPDAGRELVLFNGRRAVAWLPGKKGRARFAPLFECDFLWQLPRTGHVMPFTVGVVDVDGDGATDFVVPEPNGYLVALQRRGADGVTFDVSNRLVVPIDEAKAVGAEAGRGRLNINLRLPKGARGPDGAEIRQPLLDVSERTPRPFISDFDGDGKLDLVGRTSSNLHVWKQSGTGFSATPARSDEAPVVTDRARRSDVSYSTHVIDLDADGRSDCVIFAGDQRADEARTQILVFLNRPGREGGPLFGKQGLPDQLLVVKGFSGQPHFADVDGNGLPDLAVGSLRTDLIGKLRSAKNDTVETELYVFLNTRGRFSRQPDLRLEQRIEAENFKSLRRGFIARFIGDVTGDGTSEIVVRDRRERVRLFMVKKLKGTLVLIDRPLWERVVDKDARLFLLDEEAGGRGLMIREDAQMLMVRFPR